MLEGLQSCKLLNLCSTSGVVAVWMPADIEWCMPCRPKDMQLARRIRGDRTGSVY